MATYVLMFPGTGARPHAYLTRWVIRGGEYAFSLTHTYDLAEARTWTTLAGVERAKARLRLSNHLIMEVTTARADGEMCEYCNRDDVPLYGWYGDVWCADCIAQDHRKPSIPVAQARLGRPDWFSDRARRDEAYATPYLIPSPLVHSTALVLKGVDIMP